MSILKAAKKVIKQFHTEDPANLYKEFIDSINELAAEIQAHDDKIEANRLRSRCHTINYS